MGAVLLAVIPPLFFGQSWSEGIRRACTFLVISCPCALVISVPMSFFSGIGAASKKGVLIKGSNYLEALSEMDTIVFDKTGTLTKGEFKVTEIHAVTGSPVPERLRYRGPGCGRPASLLMRESAPCWSWRLWRRVIRTIPFRVPSRMPGEMPLI